MISIEKNMDSEKNTDSFKSEEKNTDSSKSEEKNTDSFKSEEKNTDSSKSEEKNTDSFKSDKFAVEVLVASPLSISDAERLKNWIQGQVKLPVILTVQLINSPDDFSGNGVNAGNKE